MSEAIKIDSVFFQRSEYGPYKDKFTGHIKFSGPWGESTLQLDHDLVQRIVPQIAEAIRESAGRSARMLESAALVQSASTTEGLLTHEEPFIAPDSGF